MGVLDALIYGLRDVFDEDDVQLPRRSRVQFMCEVTDDQANDKIVVFANGGGGGDNTANPIVVTSTGAINDLDSLSASVPVRGFDFTGAAPILNGITNGTAGRSLTLVAKGGALTIAHDAGGSTLANRIVTPTGNSVEIPDEGVAIVRYSTVDSRWHLLQSGDLPQNWSVLEDGRMHVKNAVFLQDSVVTFATAGDTITRDDGSFVVDGFAIGDSVVVSGSVSNNGTKTITNVTALVMTVAENLVNEGPVGGIFIRLADPGHATYGNVNGTFPTYGSHRLDSTTPQHFVTAAYDGDEFEVVAVYGKSIVFGDTAPVDLNVSIYCGDDAAIQFNGETRVAGTFEVNGNISFFGPDPATPDWEGGLRIAYWYGVNAGVSAPTDSPTTGIYQWCKNGNDSLTAMFYLYPDDVQKIIGSKRSEHQDGKLKILSLAGQTTTSSTSPTAITELSYTMPDECTVTFDFVITMCRDTAATKGGTYRGSVTYRRTSGGAPTIVGAAVYQTDQETTAGDGVLWAVSSNAIRPQVTAADTDTRYWGGEVRISQMSAA